jgi:hypothetical protein
MPRNSDKFIRLAQPVEPVRPTAERKFVILRHQGKVPAMAGCAKCQRKFFTLPPFLVTLWERSGTCSASLICTDVREIQRGEPRLLCGRWNARKSERGSGRRQRYAYVHYDQKYSRWHSVALL